ncbi:tRNA (adenosine(37)-N6)-threonylcarbamoyltransferase complex ATPase subunit type 1 TsaE [Oceanobacillus sojae]|uniref:tRNA (adenosine(37)-N6)-threonylcarbamoyltransferase complex ATPase subunit type 1 TsaE n=1 Tax=Oceanobacillus sojae TaxID=582851 RepID=UPI0009886065|nr:tRNA (adenosine(37)-N6)-threonylcarbamoyltransferase complex ATPase subunit type 1 TsaE [Oceanobacillus sojae]MCT1905480.1 tRNA (adenosine(37)-N6)-threonylcarbamoyltransferase complex ATPase subunit type 1 TsaE [Oceanobacillus sojae]
MLLRTEKDTQDFAYRLAKELQPNDVLTLEGQLGVGKTTFTKGLAKGLGVKRNISSPTFTIVKEYRGRLPLYHMDVYRLENSMEDIGFDDYFFADGITVIEWASFIEDFLPKERLDITLRYADNDNQREITLTPFGEHFEQVVKALS